MNVHNRRTGFFSIWPSGLAWLPIWLIFAGWAWSDESPTAAAFRTDLAKAEDRAETQWADGKLTIDVRSKSGIGKATLVRTGQVWPKVTVIRLHLTGLEMFRVRAGETVVGASVSSSNEHEQRVHQIVGKDEVPLKVDHQLRPQIRMLSDEGNPANEIPLKNGYFEITLPAKLFDGTPSSIDLEWIDFYRG